VSEPQRLSSLSACQLVSILVRVFFRPEAVLHASILSSLVENSQRTAPTRGSPRFTPMRLRNRAQRRFAASRRKVERLGSVKQARNTPESASAWFRREKPKSRRPIVSEVPTLDREKICALGSTRRRAHSAERSGTSLIRARVSGGRIISAPFHRVTGYAVKECGACSTLESRYS